MKVHVFSETAFVMKATGVHTAFVEHVELLKEKQDLDVVVNNEGRGDVFHSHTYGPYYLWKGMRYKGRRVFTVHVIPDSIKGSLPSWKLLIPFTKIGLKIIYSYADVCIAISPMVEKAIRNSGVKTRIVSIGNPVNTSFWRMSEEKRKSGRRMLGIGDNEFIVVGSGQIQPRKGIEDFIDVSLKVPEAKFVWAGGNPFGSITEGNQRINRRLCNAPVNFMKTGQMPFDKMPLIYSAADLMLFPSYQENSPLAPIEAAACGIPVIFRDLEEYKTLYEHPYLRAKNTEEFIDLTRRMITDQEFRQQGRKISEQLILQFDREIIRDKLLDLYKSLLVN